MKNPFKRKKSPSGTDSRFGNGPQSDDDVLIRPMRGRHELSIAPTAVLVLSPLDLRQFLREVAPEADVTKRYDPYFGLWEGIYNDTPFAVAGPALGAPQAVMVLEKLIALGARKILFFGWCGSLQPDLHIGHFVLPTETMPEEGTSGHYPIWPDEPKPSSALVKIIENTLAANGGRVRQGKVWTTDAPYRETVEKVSRYVDQNVLAVEMEASALLTVAVFRGVEAAGLLVVSDELSSLKWKHGFRDPVFKEAAVTGFRSIAEVASII
ncbi:MAG: nucleoside phosphorylase [Deltaproteobacteria bacterium]|nr:nucleoside phosphorylase [Deltaproteobacteria bacterium]